MEDQIREMLNNASAGAPVLNEPPARVLRRARARRVVNAAAVTVVAAGIVAGGITGARLIGKAETPFANPSGGVVPWVNQTVEPSPSAPPQPAEPMPRACGSSDLTLAPVETGGAAGSVGGDLRFTTKERCTLDLKRIVLALLDEKGDRLKVAFSHSGVEGIVAEARRETLLFFVWGNWCSPKQSAASVLVEFAEGGTLRAPIVLAEPGAPALTAPCQVTGSISTLDVSAAGSNEPGPEPVLPGLVAEMDVPEQARLGSRLRYLVVLHNTTNKAIALDPCPAYTQLLSTGETKNSQSARYRLNCAGAGGPIGPEARVSFEMIFDIDPSVAPGLFVISWFVDGAGPGGKAPIRIV
jgi:hypothetical protein